MTTDTEKTPQYTFASNLSNGEYDAEITDILIKWQIENANTRINDYINNLNSQYNGEPLSLAPLNNNHIDELLILGRELHQDTRKAYLKANLEQYLHDLAYIKNPTIHITESEWETIHNGNILNLAVLREWSAKKIESLDIETVTNTDDIPTKRGRKPKVVELVETPDSDSN